jgi:hypothetical protein
VDALSRAINELVPTIPSAGMLDLARRRLAELPTKNKAEPIKPTYQPGSMEWQAEQAQLEIANATTGKM